MSLLLQEQASAYSSKSRLVLKASEALIQKGPLTVCRALHKLTRDMIPWTPAFLHRGMLSTSSVLLSTLSSLPPMTSFAPCARSPSLHRSAQSPSALTPMVVTVLRATSWDAHHTGLHPRLAALRSSQLSHWLVQLAMVLHVGLQ